MVQSDNLLQPFDMTFMAEPKYTWWEKTVEYAFFLEIKATVDFAAPLSGVQENAGDGIFAEGTKFVLVEFKRRAEDIKTEKTKFKDLAGAETALTPLDGHHFIVYGALKDIEEDGKPSLKLKAHRYFSNKPLTPISSILSQGTDKASFDEYLVRLLSFKYADGRSSGSSGLAGYSSVIGTTSDEEVKTVSLMEYLTRTLGYGLKIELPMHPQLQPQARGSKPKPRL